jgi:hypothetical protein
MVQNLNKKQHYGAMEAETISNAASSKSQRVEKTLLNIL